MLYANLHASVHPIPPFPLLSPHICYFCASVSALQIDPSVPFFSRFHIYALIYNICFSLSDLIWTACGPWWRHLRHLRAVLRTSSGSGTLTQHLQNGNTENAASLALLAKQGRIQGHFRPPGRAQESAAVQQEQGEEWQVSGDDEGQRKW